MGKNNEFKVFFVNNNKCFRRKTGGMLEVSSPYTKSIVVPEMPENITLLSLYLSIIACCMNSKSPHTKGTFIFGRDDLKK